jgi:hypothetical protein
MLKRILRYLKKTKDLTLNYGGPGCTGTGLEIYTDATLGSDEDGRSISGIVIKQCGGAIRWRSIKQKAVVLDTMSSEYTAAAEGAQECLPYIELRAEIGLPVELPVPMFGDNASAIMVANSIAGTKKSRHIRLKYHFIRELIEDGTLRTVKVPGAEHEADMLTKNVPREKLTKFRAKSMNHCG